jgi:hypothetical protein
MFDEEGSGGEVEVAGGEAGVFLMFMPEFCDED